MRGIVFFRENFDAMLNLQGSSREKFIEMQGVDEKSLEKSEREEAKLGVIRGATLDAVVNHLNLDVEDDQVPALLGVEKEHSQSLISALKKDGTFEEAKISALRNKAMQQVVQESTISFTS